MDDWKYRYIYALQPEKVNPVSACSKRGVESSVEVDFSESLKDHWQKESIWEESVRQYSKA